LLVSRTIVPVIQWPLAGSADVIGIGEFNPTVFLVPRSSSPVQFGLGPTLVIPSAPNGKGWTVPIGGGIGSIFRLGSQPVNVSRHGFWNAVRPEVQGDNLLGLVTIRCQIQALFPTGG
jgi:hypothetical protein